MHLHRKQWKINTVECKNVFCGAVGLYIGAVGTLLGQTDLTVVLYQHV